MTYCSDVLTQTVKAACAPPAHVLRRSLPGRGPRSLHIVSISDSINDASMSTALAKASASMRALKARVMPGEGAPPLLVGEPDRVGRAVAAALPRVVEGVEVDRRVGGVARGGARRVEGLGGHVEGLGEVARRQQHE